MGPGQTATLRLYNQADRSEPIRSMDFEAEDTRHINRGRCGWLQLPVGLHEEMAEGCAKVGAVNVGLP